MTTPNQPIACMYCVRLDRSSLDDVLLEGARCSSFPEGIPLDIWSGDDPHLISRNGEPTLLAEGEEAAAQIGLLWPAQANEAYPAGRRFVWSPGDLVVNQPT